jgi:anti-sigma factor ChrR (cupin superfamily)
MAWTSAAGYGRTVDWTKTNCSISCETLRQHEGEYRMSANQNDNTNLRAVAAASEMQWTATESQSVRRKRFEHDGGSPPRVTSVVEYAANSQFPGHQHPLGEEFLVLQGVFSDEHGHYPTGTYVRNPPGSAHVPFSEPGCIILVKLQQMSTDERQSTVVDALGSEGWQETDDEALSRKTLFECANEIVTLYEFQPGAELTMRTDRGVIEIFVIEGCVEDELGLYMPWTWVRIPAQSELNVSSPTGAVIYLKQLKRAPW